MFRNGVERGSHVSIYNYRAEHISNNRKKTISPFRVPTVPGRDADKMRASFDGGTKIGPTFSQRLSEIERSTDLFKRNLNMHFGDSRNEVIRAQSQIDNFRTSQETFDCASYANPTWRSIKKKNWVDPKRPFKVTRPDEKLISNRQMDAEAQSLDPYTDLG